MAEVTWVRAAEESAFETEPLRTVEVDGEYVVVCKIAGRFYAVEDRCSHDDGPLGDGMLDGDTIICPRHGARFDATNGAALTMPAVTPIRAYPTKVEEGTVWVGVEL